MSRSLVIGIVVTLLIIGGLATFFYINYIKVKHVPAITAVPNDAALILEISNVPASWASFSASDLWRDLQKNEAIRQLQSRIRVLDSVVSGNAGLKDILTENKTVMSVHTQGGQKMSMLFITETGGHINALQTAEWIMKTYPYTMRKRSFEKETVYDLLNREKMPVLSLAYRDELLICSVDGTLVEEALRKLKYKLPTTTKGFEQVAAMAEVSNDVSVYINYQYFPSFLSLFSKPEYSGLFDYLKRFANWSMFGVKIEKEMVSFSGASYTDDSVFQYLDLFKTQAPVTMQLHQFLPVNTGMMLQTSYSDYTKFAADLNEYLQVHGKLDGYIRFSDSLENRYGIDLNAKMAGLIGNEAVLGMLEPLGSDYRKELFAVLNFKDKAQASALLESYVQAIEKRGERDSLALHAYNGFPVGHLQLGNFLKLYYGELFEPIESPYYTVINDAFVFANDVRVLKTIIDQHSSGNTLGHNEQFVQYASHAANTANVNFFFSPSRCFLLPSDFVTDEFFSVLNRFQYDFKKFEFFSIQFANTNNKAFFTNLSFKFNPSFKEDTRELWAAKLDTTFDVQPAIVYNSATRQNCILVQDVNNTLYYISNTGNILWRSRLSGRIMSSVQQVDAQKNGHVYYLFNTDRQACMIDENGNNLFGYPVRFPGKATAALSLFDFYGDSSYQFFVPLDNSRVIGYQANGKPVQGWNPKTFPEKVSTPLAAARIGAVPYLFAAGEKGSLLVYTLKGEQVKQPVPVSLSGKVPVFAAPIDSVSASVAFTDSNGVLQVMMMDTTLELTPVTNYNLGLKPVYEAVYYSSNAHEWMVLAGDSNTFTVFSKPGQPAFTHTLRDTTHAHAFMNKAANGEPMIGYVDRITGKLHWSTLSGALYPSFPLEGNTVFTTGNLMLDGNNYLVCGSRGNELKLIRLK